MTILNNKDLKKCKARKKKSEKGSGQQVGPVGQQVGPDGQQVGPDGQQVGPGGQQVGPGGQQVGPGDQHDPSSIFFVFCFLLRQFSHIPGCAR